jgi:hypothetical protein
MSVWFITGASRGLGLEITRQALARGDQVVATARRPGVFLVALLVGRGLPGLLYRPLLASGRQVLTAGLLQATSLSISIVGGSIGVDLRLIRPENYVALVAAELSPSPHHCSPSTQTNNAPLQRRRNGRHAPDPQRCRSVRRWHQRPCCEGAGHVRRLRGIGGRDAK